MDLKALQNGSDIRGVAMGDNATLTRESAAVLASSFYHWLKEHKKDEKITVAIGIDSRLTGPELKKACADALCAAGAEVIDCGLASTPAMFMTTITKGFMADGAIMVTASHLPKDRNGLKFFTKKGGLEKNDIARIIDIANFPHPPAPEAGTIRQADFMAVYAGILRDKIIEKTGDQKPFKGFKIIVDAGNGAGGFYARDVLEPLGADINGSQFLTPDGSFPNHIPNPEDESAMQSIVSAVKENSADFGVIFDTDVDRAGAVDKDGAELNRNRLIAAISAILLNERPGTTIVTDSITSSGLSDFIKARKGVHHRFKRGYKNVINESVRLNSEGVDSQIAIETSGHAALKENYFLDDGAYLITRLLIELASLKKQGKTVSDLIADLKEPAESAEIRLKINVLDFRSAGEKILADLKDNISEIDGFLPEKENYEGIRAHKGDDWFIARLSLHEPLIPVNIESSKKGEVKKIAEKLLRFFEKYPELDVSPLKTYVQNNG